jgi:hypothetical protein
MKASELISALQKGIKEQGDVPVFYYMQPRDLSSHEAIRDVVKDAFTWKGRRDPFLLLVTDPTEWPF